MISRVDDLGETKPARDPRVRVAAWLAVILGALCAFLFSAPLALLFLASVFATWFLVPAVARFALSRDVTGLPGGRSIHLARTPLLGGIAISLPFLAYLVGAGGAEALGLALGCALMLGVGALDDFRGLAPRHKIAGQVLGAFVLLGAGFRVPELLVPPFGAIPTAGFEMVLVVFWVVLVTNAINLIDGMDGLAAVAALVAAVACALAGLWPAAALVLAGATLGFLRHNLPQARIFLGDAGSLLLGFAVAGLLLNGAGPVNLPLALGVVALPLGDLALAAGRRWLRGKPIFTADRRHVHHRLLDAWGSPGRALLALGGFAAVLATVSVSWPDLRGLAGVAVLWGLAVLYLLGIARPRWTRILLNRKAFRRIHLVRHYATESLRLADGGADVAAALDRLAQDFDLASVRVRALRVERERPDGAVIVEEHIDCGGAMASWSAVFRPGDPVVLEERRTVLCDLLRLADERLRELGAVREPAVAAAPEAPAAPAPPVASGSGRPRVHFVADSRERLERISPLVRETRRRGVLEPVVVFTGRRDDLGLTAAQLRELQLEAPEVELDVPPGRGVIVTARVMERYDALVDAARPSVIVVGDSEACVACALVAKERGLAVAHVGAAGGGRGRLTRPLADLTLGRDLGRRPAEGQLLFLEERRGVGETDAESLVPALEAFLVSPPNSG